MRAMILAPLAAAAFSALFLRRSKWGAAAVSIASAAFSLALAMSLLLSAEAPALAGGGFELFRLGSFGMKFGFLFDSISANMAFVVCFVGLLIHIFSVGYMDDDQSKGRFFAGLSFFMFSMTGIVLSDNLFMMFVFWEFVGFSSYMLIAHYAGTDYSKMASKKAFIANRVGDFGFLVGIIWCYYHLGTVNFSEMAEALKADPSKASTSIAMLLLCGFLGKSAQFPLQVWLTDAMAGPTPVSALIHAATMVAAGVFMVVRLGVAGVMTPEASSFVLFICALMAMCAGFWALGQTDIKKTLAYSTLAHLGLMGVAAGMGAYGIAMMHLTMHAFFKAALFLVAGSVIHACSHEQNMFRMGGLFRRMPLTGAAALLAACSTISVPYFAGYYSKEMILNLSYVRMLGGAPGEGFFSAAVFAMVFAAALLTPLYMGRLFFSVFLGAPRGEGAAKARESSLWMTLPLAVLGLFSLGGAWGVVYGLKWLGGRFGGMMPESAEAFMSGAEGWGHFHALVLQDSTVSILGWLVLCCTIAMLALAYLLYGRGRDKVDEHAPLLYRALERHGWFDDIYDWYVAKVQQRAAIFLNALDILLIQGFCVRGTAALASLAGGMFRAWHSSWVSAYVLWMAVAVVTAIAIFAY